jgi:hypothetical protein
LALLTIVLSNKKLPVNARLTHQTAIMPTKWDAAKSNPALFNPAIFALTGQIAGLGVSADKP